jgi:hypothetical protein
MADLDKACDYWVSIYLRVFRMGWLNFPSDLEALPVEQKCGILRGMMVDAGKSGLLPSLEQVLDIIEKTGAAAPAPPATREAVPEVAPAQVPTEKPTSPAEQPAAETAAMGSDRPATQKQLDAIWAIRKSEPYLSQRAIELLRKAGKEKMADLTSREASAIISDLNDLKAAHDKKAVSS